MKEYKHTQIGYLLIFLYSAVILFAGYLNITTGFNPILLLVLLIMFIVLALFLLSEWYRRRILGLK